MKNDNNLFFACSLVELIGRITKNHRKDVVDALGKDLKRIYTHADVFHCEPIEKVADDFIIRNNIREGDFDPAAKAKYTVPDYWDIGEVFQRLIEDTANADDIVGGIREVYGSWIADQILNFNSDLYYQPREYLAECYRTGEIIAA